MKYIFHAEKFYFSVKEYTAGSVEPWASLACYWMIDGWIDWLIDWLLLKTWNELEVWANAQRHGRPAEYRWRPLFNAAKFGWRPLLDAVQ